MICPRPRRYQVTELDLNLRPADSKACTVFHHWLGLPALQNLPLPSSPAEIGSTSTGERHILSVFAQPSLESTGKGAGWQDPRGS